MSLENKKNTNPARGLVNERAQQLLSTLIGCYIRDGNPVGSRSLSEEGLSLSPATIRNVMADLEEMGFVTSPHTSAGRIPTAQGYRFFVDRLLSAKDGQDVNLAQLDVSLDPEQNTQSLIASASSMLSTLTNMAGVVTIPKRDHVKLRHVEFLPLSGDRVLVILVTNDHEVQNRIIHTGKQYDKTALVQAANYINEHYHENDLSAVKASLLSAMQSDKDAMNQLMQVAINMAEKAFESEQESDYVVAGQNHLLDLADQTSMDKVRALFEAFNEKQDILHLLERCTDADGIQIFIGEESGFDVLGECSLVTANYSADGDLVGALGVIGPTRMDYERVIPIVDVTARLLSAALSRDE